ncbi:MAG: response regulator [Polyangiaceae bacterium]
MRSVLFRFPDLRAFERLLAAAANGDVELSCPDVSSVDDGEWLLAVFELGPHRRATSVAARVIVTPDSAKLVLEPRDCRVLSDFVRIEAQRPAVAEIASPVTEVDDEPPRTERSLLGPSPVAARTSSSFPPRATSPSNPTATLPRVLVVDDDAVIRDMVAAMLEAVNLSVSTAGSGEEALALFRTETFDLIVLDWHMPRMTGLDLCKVLRQRPGLATLPVLFLTANTSSSDMVEAFAAGADDYVVKPFRAPELGARIFSLLRRARLSKEIA